MMQIFQVVNMFGAVRPKEREKRPYGVSRQSVVPTKDEAKIVLENLAKAHTIDEKEQQYLRQILDILSDLSEGKPVSFLALNESEFDEYNEFIAEKLASMQIDLLEEQAKIESQQFQQKNATFFNELREEGLNYDHLSDEQVEIMHLRLRERGLTERFEKNANRVDGEVFYQYTLGADDRYYKSGGVVIGSGDEPHAAIDEKVAEEVLKESAGRKNLGQFADVEAFDMPSAKKRSRTA